MPPKRKREDSDDVASDAGSVASSQHAEDGALKAAKDRECPFCHQAFTSSSLGRHLDLYIRPVNPKRPDGIHKVDEIRQLRGGITRRQPKGSGKSKDRESKEPVVMAAAVSASPVPIEVAERRPDLPTQTLPRPQHYINGMDWRVTGVINDVRSTPPLTGHHHSSTNGPTPGPRLPPLETQVPVVKTQEETIDELVETGKATELALREVLSSLAAAQRVHDREVRFQGVDLCTLSFPALCLTLLPAPRSLFSTTPFAEHDSWDMHPPLDRERRALDGVVERQRLGRRLREHITLAYDAWIRLDERDRGSRWMLEVLRSYSTAKSITEGLETQLALAKQRIEHLESEYELLSRCQLPRERLLHPATTIPITTTTLDHFSLEGSADSLVEKNKATIRAVARPKRALAALQKHYVDNTVNAGPPSSGKEPGTMDLSADMVMHGAVFGVEGPMARNEQYPPRPASHLVSYPQNVGKAPVSQIVDHG